MNIVTPYSFEMVNSLLLDKGEIILSDHKITIIDKAGRTHKLKLLSSLLWMGYGIVSVLRFLKTGNEFLLWSGILIGVLHFIGMLFLMQRSTKNDIMLNEIIWASFKGRNGNQFIDLKLNNGLKRRISKIEPIASELRTYFMQNKVEVK